MAYCLEIQDPIGPEYRTSTNASHFLKIHDEQRIQALIAMTLGKAMPKQLVVFS